MDAVFDHLTAMSTAQLRELANTLPRPSGNAGNLPSLPAYLPKPAYVKNSAKYIVGPIALSRVASPISGDLVDFNAGAEVTLAHYDTAGGEATLALIAYPTPQIATEHLRRIDAARQQAGSPLANAGPFFDRRTGPMVVAATGQLSDSEGKSLVGLVNYEADVTWNENTLNDKKNNIGNLVVNALLLCAILMGFALVIGVAFGGVRILIRKVFPETILGRGRRSISFPSTWRKRRPKPPNRRLNSSIDGSYPIVGAGMSHERALLASIDCFRKLLKTNPFIPQKTLDTPLFRLIRFRQKVLTALTPLELFSLRRESHPSCRVAFLFSEHYALVLRIF